MKVRYKRMSKKHIYMCVCVCVCVCVCALRHFNETLDQKNVLWFNVKWKWRLNLNHLTYENINLDHWYMFVPFAVNALSQVKKSLIDPFNHLWNWNKGDPCALNWTGVSCVERVRADGYFHVQELYGSFFLSLFFNFYS